MVEQPSTSKGRSRRAFPHAPLGAAVGTAEERAYAGAMSGPGGDAVHPSGDSRFGVLDDELSRQDFQASALLELLHTAQELFGFLSGELLRYLANRLGLPLAQVQGVASFYNLFTFSPPGEHTCTVCLGTACYVKGAGEILAGLEELRGVPAGPGGRLSVVVARCVGACGAAPAVAFDGQLRGHQGRAAVLARVKGWTGP
jgi:bidirectional [NiFe] hydrogenase diaphorase subunit